MASAVSDRYFVTAVPAFRRFALLGAKSEPDSWVGDTTGSWRRRHELPVRAARDTVMKEAITNLPPVVIADLFDIHAGTADRWAQFDDNAWSDYRATYAA
ncbi:hypothetical protein [Streptomyces sp. NPDC000229]|uniref:hypothetical protein n=1 Tax=Streptomyces sp. NPDC000229 TaxID=3154247 RepID=UPI00332FB102